MKMPSDYEYDPHFGSIRLVDLVLPKLPEKITLEGKTFLRKSEFHITLVMSRQLAPLIDEPNQAKIEAEIVEQFNKFIKQQPLTDYELLDELRLVSLGAEQTVIVMANLPGLNKFFDELRRKYAATLPMQPTHVTLYTFHADAGIGILSDEELHKISAPVKIPQLAGALK